MTVRQAAGILLKTRLARVSLLVASCFLFLVLGALMAMCIVGPRSIAAGTAEAFRVGALATAFDDRQLLGQVLDGDPKQGAGRQGQFCLLRMNNGWIPHVRWDICRIEPKMSYWVKDNGEIGQEPRR